MKIRIKYVNNNSNNLTNKNAHIDGYNRIHKPDDIVGFIFQFPGLSTMMMEGWIYCAQSEATVKSRRP